MSEQIERQILDDRQRIQMEALMRRVLDGLRQTVQVRPISVQAEPFVDQVHVDFTDKSARFIAPLVEAVDILEAIIFASDGCIGHRQCAHSMEPWQRARALLQGKWEAAQDGRHWPELHKPPAR